MACQDADDHYARAVALVLQERIPEALAELKLALADPANRAEARQDDLLAPLRERPEFQELLAEAEEEHNS